VQPLNELLTASANDEPKTLQWNDQTTMYYQNNKQALSKVTLLFHPKQDAPTSIMTDASLCAMRAVLQKYINEQWCLIAYFSKRLKFLEAK